MPAIKVFIGTEPKTEIARKVLEYSILKHTKKEIEFTPMMGEDWKIMPPTGVGTGFSLLRWDIPRRCNYEGAAIYLDADILCLEDIYQLYRADIDYPNPDASHWMTYQKCKWFDYPTPESSVFLVDCLKAKTNQKTIEEILQDLQTDKNRQKYVQHMRALSQVYPPQKIPDSFNRLNTLVQDKTRFLHFTKEPEQPWFNPKHAHADLWKKYFIECFKETDTITKEEIEQALATFKPHTKKERGTGLHPYWKFVLSS